jgi:hypothetical protein
LSPRLRGSRGPLVALSALMAMSCGRNPIEWLPMPALDAAADTRVDRPGSDGKISDGANDGAVTADGRTDADAGGDRPGTLFDGREPIEVRADAVPDADARVDVPRDLPSDPSPPPPDGGCAVDCTQLPNLRPGVVGVCRAGVCALPAGACQDGFAHCSFNPNDGCESDLSRVDSCGACGSLCTGYYPQCNAVSYGHVCGPRCDSPYPDACGYQCTDTQSDVNNCGACGVSCYLWSTVTQCQQGHCVTLGCSDPTYADCTSDPGCETQLGTDTNCSACGDPSCQLANTLFTCSNGGTCNAAVCASGFANCSATSPDCEAAFTSAPSCMPAYLSTLPLATQSSYDVVTAVAPDGSMLLAGIFIGSVDFDPTAGRDVQTAANDPDGYITKINPDGSYAWTRILVGRGDSILVSGLTVTASGAIIATGFYDDTIDLDPGVASDVRFTASPYQLDPFVVKLAPDGSYVWGRTFTGSSGANGQPFGVAADASESVYIAGSYIGEIDFDPGATVDLHTAVQNTGMLVKLTAAGAYAWMQSIDNGGCSGYLSAVTVATDGSVWSTGQSESGSGCPRNGDPSVQRQNDVLIAKHSAAGVAQGSWFVASTADDYGAGIAAGKDGAVFIGGVVQGGSDFDPGPGTVTRLSGRFSTGFVLKLDATGVFRWVSTLPDIPVNSLASAPDGGVIAGANLDGAFVTRLNADGIGVWTFTTGGDSAMVQSLAANGGSFSIAGTNTGASADFNPGPDLDIVFGGSIFLSRFQF